MAISAPSFAQRAPAAQTTVPVSTIDNPAQLISLSVVDASGAPIGNVRSVKTGSDGKASRIFVALTTTEGAGRIAAIRAERLSFDKTNHVLMAQFSPAQLSQLAATASTAGGIDTGQSSGLVSRRVPSGGDAQPPMAH